MSFPSTESDGGPDGGAVSTSPQILAARSIPRIPAVSLSLVMVRHIRATHVTTTTTAVVGTTAVVPPGPTPGKVVVLAASEASAAVAATVPRRRSRSHRDCSSGRTPETVAVVAAGATVAVFTAPRWSHSGRGRRCCHFHDRRGRSNRGFSSGRTPGRSRLSPPPPPRWSRPSLSLPPPSPERS